MTDILAQKPDQPATIEPPASLPAAVAELRAYYQQERTKIESEEQAKDPSDRFWPTNLANKLRDLNYQVLLDVAEIAQEDIGAIPQSFSIVLLAGSSRGPALDSDLDYVLVYDGKPTKVFDRLADKIDEVLFQVGIEADNLIKHFSNGERTVLHLKDIDSYRYVYRVLPGGLPVLELGDPTLAAAAKDVCAQQFSVQKSQWRYRTSSWLDIFWSIHIRESSNPQTVAHPGVELRRFYMAQAIMQEQGETFSPSPELLEAKDFFERLRNGVWSLHRVGSLSVTAANLSQLSLLLGFKSVATFGQEIKTHKQRIDGHFGKVQTKLGISQTLQQLYFCYRNLLDKIGKLFNFLRYGGARVILVLDRPDIKTKR